MERRDNVLKKIGVVAVSLGLVASSIGSVQVAEASKPEWVKPGKPDWVEKGKVENVIYMIPDGFNADYATNYRIFKGEEAVWDDHLKGMYTTHSANSNITDSAAAGTAMATGVKTNNGMLSVDPDGDELETVLEASKDKDMATGLIATSTITHATPAAFASHVEDRNNETEIARQMIANEVDVLLGGGKSNFLPESEGGEQEEGNLLKEAEEQGYEVIEDREELQKKNEISLKDNDKLLGLFADGPLSDEMIRDKEEQPSLAEMTEAGIDILNQERDGFFLMVEGSQIDWAGHDNDAAWAMNEVEAFEEAVKEAIEFAKKDGETLVVIGSDHETGGMTVGANGSASANPELLRDVKATGAQMAAELNEERSNIAEVIKQYTDFGLNETEIEQIKKAEDPAVAINKVISDRANVGWTSSNHTGVQVPVFAYGPKADEFVGFYDNTDLPNKIAEALKLKLDQ